LIAGQDGPVRQGEDDGERHSVRERLGGLFAYHVSPLLPRVMYTFVSELHRCGEVTASPAKETAESYSPLLEAGHSQRPVRPSVFPLCAYISVALLPLIAG